MPEDSREHQAELAHGERNCLERNISDLVNRLDEWVWEMNPQGVYTYASPRVRDLLGYEPEEVIGKTPYDLMRPKEAERFREWLAPYLARRMPFSRIEKTNRHRSGHEVVLESTGVPVFAPNGAFIGFHGIDRNITEHKRAEKEKERLLMIVENTPDFISFSDPDGNILYLNRTWKQLLGIADGAELSGLRIPDLHPPWAGRRILGEGLKAAARHGVWRGETALLAPDGREIPVSQIILAHLDDSGNIDYFSTIVRDITRERELIEKIRGLAYTDTLTGLSNRVHLYDFAHREIERATRDKTEFALFFLDLDGFKWINDSLGHNAGDALLRETAARLKRIIGGRGLIARLGGDEFIILLSEYSAIEEVEDVAGQLLAALSEPFELEGTECLVTASIGISCFPEDGKDMETLLRHADSAMYRSKENGNNQYLFFSSSMELPSQAYRLINELHQGIQQRQFELYFQPQVDAATGDMVGMEALIRWLHPARGLISAGSFVPLAEQTGMIAKLDAWVVAAVCDQLRQWQDGGYPKIPVALNLSARTLQNKRMMDELAEVIAASGVDPGQLAVELTESAVMSRLEHTAEILRNLKEMGMRIALDDFGKGYSSMSYLKSLPVDVIKIDRYYVEHILTDEFDKKIVQTIIELAHHFNLKVIAEGVESSDQLMLLNGMGCDCIQGYYISHPLPASEVQKYMEQGRTRQVEG